MPPHCDTMDGPVVKAASTALEKGNVNLILPYAPVFAEEELRSAFQKTLQARGQGGAAAEVADRWFFETAVRLHREGEGAPYTGLKPAGLDPGPAVPRAERAIETGNAREVIDFLMHSVEQQLLHKFEHLNSLKNYDPNDISAARAYVEAMLGFQLCSHHLYTSIKSSPHGKAEATVHGH